MIGHLSRLIRFRELLWMLAMSELKARHRQTMLGVLWALAQPLSMMLVFTVVFSLFVKVPIQGASYAVFAYIGLWSWLFFANCLSNGITSVVANMNLVTKVAFPREVIPLAKMVMVGVDFLIGGVFLCALLLLFGVPMTIAVLVVPGIIMIQLMFTAGLVFLGSALYVLKRDIGTLLPLILQIWMFLSPVFYPVTVIPEAYQRFYLMNPVAMIIEAYRSALLFGTVPGLDILGSALAVAIASLTIGYAYFKSVELKFADVM